MSVSPLFSFAASAIAACVGGLKRRLARPTAVAHRIDPTTRYRCVTIEPCDAACSAVLAFSGTRFLSADAPSVPLPECARIPGADRTCTYRHHPDRRFHLRRTAFGCGAEPLFEARTERRGRPGRRRSDYDDIGIDSAG